jgi:CRISPR/Cas system-associated exonuclease Cas4 (RecB family)
MQGYQKRTRNVFDPKSKQLFKLSRSRIENFIRCPRCFYLDRRMGVEQPPGYPFTLNTAVDILLKKEFDIHRAKGVAHPLMKKYSIDAIPFAHEKLDQWRENFVGVEYLHEPTNLLITGAVDDLWVNPQGEIHVVDYKATSKDAEVGIEAEWQSGYRNQMEIYQWLLRRNELVVSDTGYFVYANGRRDREAFDGKLEFDVAVIPYKGSDDWVEKTIIEAHKCLMGDKIPSPEKTCPYCAYRKLAAEIENE